MPPPTCSFEHCTKPVNAKGLCAGHYQQHRNGHPLERLALVGEAPRPCPPWKPQETFNRLWLTNLPEGIE